jgi:hypothetical protein
MIPVGVYGVFLGWGDIATGNTLWGVPQAFGGVVLALYAIRAAVVDAQRMANPIRLLIARDGFELFPGRRSIPWFELFPSQRPISWDEVATVSDPKSPTGEPRTLRVQLDDPRGFAERLALAPFARLMLRINRGDLVLGSGTALPLAEVERLMRRHLSEFRRSRSAPAVASVRNAAPKGRRPARKR